MDRFTDRLDMTIAVDSDDKPQANQTFKELLERILITKPLIQDTAGQKLRTTPLT